MNCRWQFSEYGNSTLVYYQKQVQKIQFFYAVNLLLTNQKSNSRKMNYQFV